MNLGLACPAGQCPNYRSRVTVSEANIQQTMATVFLPKNKRRNVDCIMLGLFFPSAQPLFAMLYTCFLCLFVSLFMLVCLSVVFVGFCLVLFDVVVFQPTANRAMILQNRRYMLTRPFRCLLCIQRTHCLSTRYYDKYYRHIRIGLGPTRHQSQYWNVGQKG